MTYEKKYRIARAGLDHMERAFVEMNKAHEEYRKTCHSNINFALAKVNEKQKIINDLNKLIESYNCELKKERAKTWWQKLKETIKSKYQ
jgi:hypothetical protein